VAVDVDDLSRAFAGGDSSLTLHDGGVAVLLRDEADLVRLLLAGHGQAGRAGDLAHLRLRHLAEGEERVAELLLGELEEEIRLVLGAVDGLAQLERAVAGAVDPRVMPG